jgi:GT2 family glycosyltransferase
VPVWNSLVGPNWRLADMSSSQRTMHGPRVSVIILNYNGLRFIRRCLDAVLQTDYPDLEIILADNGSTDGSLDWMEGHYRDPRLRSVRLSENWGYAGGNNRAAGAAQGEVLVFLNVDTEVEAGWLDPVVDLFDADQQVGIVQSRLRQMRDPDRLESAGHYLDWLGLSHARGAGTRDQGQYREVEEVFGAVGAAMAVRRSLFEYLGGFDSSYFCYFEEIDLCWRAWLCGHKTLFAPDSVVYHYRGGSSAGDASSHAHTFFLAVRNRIVSFLKLLEWPLLLIWLPANVMKFAMVAMSALVRRGDARVLFALFRGILSNAVNLRGTMHKRRQFRKLKTTSNWALIRRGLIRPIHLPRLRRGTTGIK